MLKGLLFILCVMVGGVSHAVDTPVPFVVNEIESKYGIKAWFVPKVDLPLVFYAFVFKNAGYAYDPKSKLGLAALVTGVLNEGAGRMSSRDFTRTLERLGGKIFYNLEANDLVVTVSAPREAIRQVVELFYASVASPRVDEETLSEVKGRQISVLRKEEGDPSFIAKTEFFKTAFPDSGYSHTRWGSVETVNAIKVEDLKAKIVDVFNRINMRVVVFGNTQVSEVKSVLDDYLIEFPLVTMGVKTLEQPILQAAGECVSIQRNIPQNIILFGHKGLDPSDKDFYNLVVLNYILGGDGLESLLMKEIREKKGYTYGIKTRVRHSPVNLLLGSTATSNDTASQVREEILKVLTDLKQSGLDSARVEEAKGHLVDTFFLSMDTSMSALSLLVQMQQGDLGTDYLERYVEGVRKVSSRELNSFIKSFLEPQAVLFVNVGAALSPTTGTKVCPKS